MGANRRHLGYGGLLLLLISLVLFLVSVTESRYESTVVRAKGRVLAKQIRPNRNREIYGVTYRVTIESRTLEREGDVGSRAAWDAIRIGDEVDVESVGVTPNETRLAVERTAGSGVYRVIRGTRGNGRDRPPDSPTSPRIEGSSPVGSSPNPPPPF